MKFNQLEDYSGGFKFRFSDGQVYSVVYFTSREMKANGLEKGHVEYFAEKLLSLALSLNLRRQREHDRP